MNFKNLPTLERLEQLLDYDPNTGMFRWKLRGIAWWDMRFCGEPAGHISRWGYRIIIIDYVGYRAARLAWKYWYGTDPTLCIDHKNCNKADDRIENLRQATISQNGQNIHGASRLGLPKGVCRIKNRYMAQIKISPDAKRTCLGSFATPEQAHTAYVTAAKKYFGEFARGE